MGGARSTDRLDYVYNPPCTVVSELRHYFQPMVITDAAGEVDREVLGDVMEIRYPAAAKAAVQSRGRNSKR